MKIGYFADGPWSHLALEKIIQHKNLEIAFIVPRFDTQDPVLLEYSRKLNVPFIPHENVNSPEFLSLIQKYKADIFVSMSFNQILKSPILNAAPLGFINCHAGALPFYKGRNILNWAIINGEKKFGVTVHHVDLGIDTGDIVLQNFEEITPEDDYGSILKKAIVLCAQTLENALEGLAKNNSPRIKQSSLHPVGFYCSQRSFGDEWLDWNQPSERIHNFIRGISLPGPCARTYLGEKIIAIQKSALIPDAPIYGGHPGQVVGRNTQGIIVKTGDSTLFLTMISDVSSEGKLENSRIPNLKMGTRLGLSLHSFQNRILQLEAENHKLKLELLAKRD